MKVKIIIQGSLNELGRYMFDLVVVGDFYLKVINIIFSCWNYSSKPLNALPPRYIAKLHIIQHIENYAI